MIITVKSMLGLAKNVIKFRILGGRAFTVKNGDSLLGKGIKLQEARSFDDGVADGFKSTTAEELFKGKKVALFGLPGAFTGVCSKAHVPSWRDNAEALHEAGVDEIVCLAVNDAFCMNAWQKVVDPEKKIKFMGDPLLEFTKATGLEVDLTAAGLGVRAHRYSLLVNDGVVEGVFAEKGAQDLEVSNGEYMLSQLKK
eukprot:TRINITY_DN1046_c0_g1_i2.p1 TRINITY_DN1046_c0_g1~~TRINITY_DN1046_c0_g1_i2.p1  ORF type:complete len:197 (-),score=77.12 TRINITY_DN1046_c0_g1_i2:228-818(-)